MRFRQPSYCKSGLPRYSVHAYWFSLAFTLPLRHCAWNGLTTSSRSNSIFNDSELHKGLFLIHFAHYFLWGMATKIFGFWIKTLNLSTNQAVIFHDRGGECRSVYIIYKRDSVTHCRWHLIKMFHYKRFSSDAFMMKCDFLGVNVWKDEFKVVKLSDKKGKTQ